MTAVAMLLSLPLGCLLGGFLWGRLYIVFIRRFSGWPFRNGEMVFILVGPHCGKVARIYEVWAGTLPGAGGTR